MPKGIPGSTKLKKARDAGLDPEEVGHKGYVFAEEDYEKLQLLAAVLSPPQIAAYYEVDKDIFTDMLARDPRAKQAVDKGQAVAVAQVAGNLVQAARGEPKYVNVDVEYEKDIEVTCPHCHQVHVLHHVDTFSKKVKTGNQINTAAAIFFLKIKGGWTETIRHEVPGAGEGGGVVHQWVDIARSVRDRKAQLQKKARSDG